MPNQRIAGVGTVLGAGRFASARHILLPAALPGYLAELKQGWAFSWRSLMAAELIANSPHLGHAVGPGEPAGWRRPAGPLRYVSCEFPFGTSFSFAAPQYQGSALTTAKTSDVRPS